MITSHWLMRPQKSCENETTEPTRITIIIDEITQEKTLNENGLKRTRDI